MQKTFNLMLKTTLSCSLLAFTGNALANSIQYWGGLSFENPATLSQVKQQQFIAGDAWVNTKMQFNGTTRQQIGPIFGRTYDGIANATNGLLLPFARYAVRLTPKWVIGFDISSPFATNLKWPKDAITRYASVKTGLRTTDYSPNVSFNILPQLAIGAGLDIMYGKAQLNRMIFVPGRGDLQIRNSGDNTAWGGHGGITYKMGQATLFGLTYYSKVTFHLSGDSTFPGRPTTRVTTNLAMPSTTIFNVIQGLSKQWLVTGGVSFTDWLPLRVIALKNTALGTPAPVDFYSQNTWRYYVGTQYTFNEQWALRGQVAYDEAPANPSYESIALPSAPLYSVLIGAHYQMTKPLAFDLYYGHGFIRNSSINNFQTRSFGRISMEADRVEGRFTINV